MRHQYCKSLAQSRAQSPGPAPMQLFCAAGCTAKTNGAHTHSEETSYTYMKTHEKSEQKPVQFSCFCTYTHTHTHWSRHMYIYSLHPFNAFKSAHWPLNSCLATISNWLAQQEWTNMVSEVKWLSKDSTTAQQRVDQDALDWKRIMGILFGSEWFSRCASC